MSTTHDTSAAAPTPANAPAQRTKLPYRSRTFAWGIASVVLLAIGSLGPWATILSVELSGTSDGRDGILTLILAGIAGLLIALRVWTWGVLVAGVLALAELCKQAEMFERMPADESH